MISDPAFRHTKFMGDLAGVEKTISQGLCGDAVGRILILIRLVTLV